MEQPVDAPAFSRNTAIAAALLALAIAAAFFNGIHGAFIFDDKSAIEQNESLRQANWFMGAIHPPHASGLTVDGRPILNLSLAINWALTGHSPEGFHATNIVIHILSALVLFGIVRRLFAHLSVPEPDLAAFAAALLWAVHPLNTESVTYMVQRAESLMGLFYLLTLYCFLKSLEAKHALIWLNLSVAACMFGVGTKEVIVSAPVIVFLYDRAFISGSVAEAWRQRKGYYLGLLATWLVLGFLVVSTRSRGATSGPTSTASAIDYLESQPMAILRYLRLAFWPQGFNFDYGLDGYGDAGRAIRTFPWVALLALGSLYGLWKNTAWGLAGFFFFAILAPTTFMPGTRQSIAEHRMYLALIPIVLLFVWALWHLAGKKAFYAVVLCALVMGWVTTQRNTDFANETILYQKSVQQLDTNHFGWADLAVQYMDDGRLEEARKAFVKAVELAPSDPLPWDDLGAIEVKEGHLQAAIEDYEHTLRILPTFFQGHVNLANALLLVGEPEAAMTEYQLALKAQPGDPIAENGIAVAYEHLGAPSSAILHFKKSLVAEPHDPDTWANLASACTKVKDYDQAIAAYGQAIALRPGYYECRYNLGTLLFERGRTREAVLQLREAIRIHPKSVAAHDNLGNAYLKEGHFADAAQEYTVTLRLDPGRASTHYNLASAYSQLGRKAEAAQECREALRLKPDMKPAQDMLAGLSKAS